MATWLSIFLTNPFIIMASHLDIQDLNPPPAKYVAVQRLIIYLQLTEVSFLIIVQYNKYFFSLDYTSLFLTIQNKMHTKCMECSKIFGKSHSVPKKSGRNLGAKCHPILTYRKGRKSVIYNLWSSVNGRFSESKYVFVDISKEEFQVFKRFWCYVIINITF